MGIKLISLHRYSIKITCTKPITSPNMVLCFYYCLVVVFNVYSPTLGKVNGFLHIICIININNNSILIILQDIMSHCVQLVLRICTIYFSYAVHSRHSLLMHWLYVQQGCQNIKAKLEHIDPVHNLSDFLYLKEAYLSLLGSIRGSYYLVWIYKKLI